MSAAVIAAVPAVQRVCRARLGGATRPALDWEDAAQEALIGLLRVDRDSPDISVTPELAVGTASWRCTDARRDEARHLRRQAALQAELPTRPAIHPGPDVTVIRAEQARELRRLVATTLTDHQRDVVVCRWLLELSAEETAARLGMSSGAVRVTQHRALTRLRASLAGAR